MTISGATGLTYFALVERYLSLMAENGGSIEETMQTLEEEFLGIDEAQAIFDRLRTEAAGRPITIPGNPATESWYNVLDTHEYWPAYLDLISDENRVNLPSDAVESLSNSTQRVMDFLFDPSQEGSQRRHGLVVGYIQSGKTAHYSGLIARAADSGFKLIVVLAGGNSNLRNQTQRRLSCQVSGAMEDIEGNHVDGSSFRTQWHEVTRMTNILPGERGLDEGDIGGSNSSMDDAYFNDDSPILVVMKKLPDALNYLQDYISGIDESLIGEIPLLLIDDECDYASVDISGQNQEENLTNRLVRQTLAHFSKSAYIGYTASPFANVFAALGNEDDDLPTLFPHDFIMALSRPRGYLGFDELFPPEGELSPYPHCRTCIVNPGEAQWLRDLTDMENPTSDVGEGMNLALIDHLLTGAIKGLRGVGNPHHTMLIHTHIRTDRMHPVLTRVRRRLAEWQEIFFQDREWLDPAGIEVIDCFEQRYFDEFVGKWNHTDDPPGFHEIHSWICDSFLRGTFHVIEVSSSEEFADDELDYGSPQYQESGLNVIAVGGQQLSRGLTLEGLTISYFIRTAAELQYDTVMQQGRWFGFRQEYEDLVRIHTTETLYEFMVDLGNVERELRASIEGYQNSGLTPREFGIRVLSIMGGRPTRPLAMQNVNEVEHTVDQTIVPRDGVFNFRNTDGLRENLRVTADFLNELGHHNEVQHLVANATHGSIIWNDVGHAVVREYLMEISDPARNTYEGDIFNRVQTMEYIDRRHHHGDGEFQEWDVALVSLEEEEETAQSSTPLSEFGFEHSIIRPRRSRIVNTNSISTPYGPRDTAIGLGHAPTHYYVDGRFSMYRMWEDRGHRPLLLIYIYDSGYSPSATYENRTSLFIDQEIPVDVVCPVIVIPEASMTEEEREEEARGFYHNAGIQFEPEITEEVE